MGVSGSIYCIIRSAPLLGFSRFGTPVIFSTQGRDQFLLEGIVVAVLTLVISFFGYLLRFSTKLHFPLLRHLCVLVCMAGFCAVGCELWQLYVLKTPWYSIKDTIPGEIWRFMTSSVKKNSGLPKRLWRLSEIWLFEAKEWTAFYKKFEVLIVDYLRRQVPLFASS